MDFLARMGELYKEHPHWLRELNRERRYNFEGILNAISEPIGRVEVELLESYNQAFPVCTLLMFMDPLIVLKEFGEDVLIWSWLSYGIMDERLELYEAVIGRQKDMNALELSRRVLWSHFCTTEFKSVMKFYDVYMGLEERVERLDLQECVQRHAKVGVMISANRGEDYCLEVLRPRKIMDKLSDIGYAEEYVGLKDKSLVNIYLDAPLAVCLKYKDEPQAVVSFNFTPEGDALKIYQLQGVLRKVVDDERTVVGEKHARGLMPLCWQNLLVDITAQIAQSYGFTHVAIRSAHNNSWTKPYYDKTIHLPLDAALQKYDAVAQNLGFIQGQEKDWYKFLRGVGLFLVKRS